MNRPTSSAYAATAEAAIWLSAALMALLHVLPTPLNPVTDMVSEYALGEFPLLADGCFLAIAVAALTLALGLRDVLPADRTVTTAIAGLAVTALGAAVLPFFLTDPQSPPSSTHGRIHVTAALVSMTSLTAAIFALALRFRAMPRWNRLALPGFICAGIMAASMAPMLVRTWPGIMERLLILAGMLWIAMTSRFLRTGAGR
ncbi:DUF998 domain-containing protein [Streptomyces sp. NPDC004065]|uniref:DUF998 domain-containing protein n=1 Tax=Streptomyces sp. NPDC004065 TaxID=3364689 RepID=UPI00384CF1EE